jgi:soluble lytic murein transglycosylase
MIGKKWSRDDILALADAKAREFGVPPWLGKAVIEQESAFNTTAVNGSDGGSAGLMQVHPSNFARFKVRAEDMKDPLKNIPIGMQLLKEALAKTGDIPTALIDYNAGQSRLDRFNRNERIKESGHLLRPITEAYIPSVLLRGQKYGGPQVTADDWNQIRGKFGREQIPDEEIFRKTGMRVQGLQSASKPVAPPLPNQVVPAAIQREAVARNSVFAPEADAPISFDPMPFAQVKEPEVDKSSTEYQRKAVAAAFDGEDQDEQDYPDWLMNIVRDSARYA